MRSSQPIGIFDSGVGGLTIAKAVVNLLPKEDIIYFGDTAHLPYGDKSQNTLQKYSIEIAKFLLEKGCKVILIACNSASAAAFEVVKQYVGNRAIVMNVVDPVIKFLGENYLERDVGLIGTKQTVGSKVYEQKILEANLAIKLSSHATPLLVPAIEEGFVDNVILDDLLNEYLGNDKFQGIDALVLGCTHYPLIKERIENYYKKKTDVIAPADIIAEGLKNVLYDRNLLNSEGGSQRFFVSDYTDSFLKTTKMFFGRNISLEYCSLDGV